MFLSFQFCRLHLAHSLCSGHRDLFARSWATKIIPSQDLCLRVLHWNSILGSLLDWNPIYAVRLSCNAISSEGLLWLFNLKYLLLSHLHLTPLFYFISSAFGIRYYLFFFFSNLCLFIAYLLPLDYSFFNDRVFGSLLVAQDCTHGSIQ